MRGLEWSRARAHLSDELVGACGGHQLRHHAMHANQCTTIVMRTMYLRRETAGWGWSETFTVVARRQAGRASLTVAVGWEGTTAMGVEQRPRHPL